MKKLFAFLKNRGFTLVEALVATIIAGYCILPIMGTLHMGVKKTQGFDHYEKLRLLARSRLNKELSVGAFDHTAIDTTTTYHYVYYNTDAEPQLLTIDTNIASGSTASAGTFLNIATVSSILYSYKVSVAIKENLQLGTSTQNIQSDYLKSISGLKALTVKAELEYNDNVGTELEIDPSDPNSPPLPSISLFSLLNLPSFSDDYIWISNPKNVEIIAIDPMSRTKVDSFLLRLDDITKPRDDGANDGARPWNIAIHPNQKFIAIQCKNKIKALNIDPESQWYGLAKEIWPMNTIYNKDGTTTNISTIEPAYGLKLADVNKDDKNKAAEDRSIVFRPDGKMCYVAAHEEKMIFAFVASNTENWVNLALINKTAFTTTTDKSSFLHAGNDGYLYSGPTDLNVVFRFPMYAPNPLVNPEKIDDPDSDEKVEGCATTSDGKEFYILWDKSIITRHDSRTGAKIGGTTITPTDASKNLKDITLSDDGRYLAMMDPTDAAGKGGMFVLNLSINPITSVNYNLNTQVPAILKRATPDAIKKTGVNYVLFSPQSQDFVFDDITKPNIFAVDIPGLITDSYTSSLPPDRVINFATIDKSEVAMNLRIPQFVLVGTADKSIQFLDVNTGKTVETKKIDLEAVPVDAAISPQGEKLKVVFGNARAGVDTFDIPTRIRTQNAYGAQQMYEVAIPNTYFHTDPNQTHFSTLDKHSTNTLLNGYWADVPLPGTPPSDYRMPNDVDFSCDWVPQNMVSLTNGGFLYLFKKADGSTCLDWVGKRPWGTYVDNYERFARWYNLKSLTLKLPWSISITAANIDGWNGRIELLRHLSFPNGSKVTHIAFDAAATGKSLTPVIVEIAGGVNTIRDIGSPISVSATGVQTHAITWLNGGVLSANRYPGWWHGSGTTTNVGLINYSDSLAGPFISDYSAPGSTQTTHSEIPSLALGATISDPVYPPGAQRAYKAQFIAEIPGNFPPLNAVNISVSPDDRYLAIETIGTPNQIHLYDFAANNFYQETQLNGLLTDYRDRTSPFAVYSGNASSKLLFPTAGCRKLVQAFTGNEIWGALRTTPLNYSWDFAATSTQIIPNNAMYTRIFGYLRPESEISQVGLFHNDSTRLFLGSSFVPQIGDWRPAAPGFYGSPMKTAFTMKIGQSEFVQAEHDQDDGNTGLAILKTSDAGAALFAALTHQATGRWSSPAAPWADIPEKETMPLRFTPAWLRTYNLTGCDNDQVSAMVWSRDLGNPLLFHLDTIQDDFWAIRPGNTAPTRFDMGGTFNTSDRQLAVSDDGQKLIFAKEDTNEVVFIDIANPASFSFNGATRAVSTLTGFGSIARIATMTATPKVLATLPFNRYKSTPHSGSYQQVATLSVNISGINNAALASGGIYILGGSPTINGAFGGSVTVDGTPTDKIFKFDPTYTYAPGTTISPLVATLTRPIKRHAVAAYDNEVFVFNGRYTATDNTSWVQKFNPTTGEVMSSFDPVAVTTTEFQVTLNSGSLPTPVAITSSGNFDGSYPAIDAFDNDEGDAAQLQSGQTSGWIAYNAGNDSLKFIANKVAINNRHNTTFDKCMKDYKIFGSNSPGTFPTGWTEIMNHTIPKGSWIYTSTNSGTSVTGNSSPPYGPYFHSFTNTTAYRYYLVQFLNNYAGTDLGICREIILFHENVKKLSPVSVSASDADGSHPATHAFDGNTSTEWDSAATPPSELIMDMGAGNSFPLQIIRMLCSTDGRVKQFSLAGSNDNFTTQTIININGASPTGCPNTGSWQTYYLDNSIAYRYYKFKAEVSHDTVAPDIEINELELYSMQTTSAAAPGPVMTKTLLDNRSQNIVCDTAACATPYGIMVAGGGSTNCIIYWPHGIDNYTDNASYSLGISKSLPPLPANRSYHNLIWHKGRVFRVGGSDGTALNSIDVFSFDTNAWTNVSLTTVASFPVNGAQLKRDNAAACSLGDEIFMFGGYDGTALKNDAIAWNPETGNVRLLGAMPMAGNYAKSAVACGSSIYLIGGATNATSGGTAGIWKFTP